MKEKNGVLNFKINLAGFEKDQIKLESRDGFIYVEARSNGESYHNQYDVPRLYDISTADARFENGLLEITIQKLEKNKPAKIKIK